MVERRAELGAGAREGFMREQVLLVDTHQRQNFTSLVPGPDSACGESFEPLTLAPLLLGAAAFERISVAADWAHREAALHRELQALSFQQEPGQWKVAEMIGRVSGDARWRRERGELGTAQSSGVDTM